MENKNALISMAYFSESAQNPYAIFCEYIKYCIYTHTSKILTLGEIQDAIGKEFDIRLPNHILSQCLFILEKEKSIFRFDHRVKRIGQYDPKDFERTRSEYKKIESDLIANLCSFVSTYGRNWNESDARSILTKVLDKQGLAFEIFIHEEDKVLKTLDNIILDDDSFDNETDSKNIEGPLYTDEYLVGKYIKEIISTDNIYKEYLIKICEGLMICSGAYQLPSDNAKVVPVQIKGSCFFLDTKCILRFIGCASEAAISATKELVKLIQDGGGIVCYYPQTKEEVEAAFDDAIKKIQFGYPIYYNEMRLYTIKIKNSIAILKAKKASFVNELINENIYEKPHDNFTDTDNIKYGFDISVLKQYMHQNLIWKEKAIDNDAMSIWETHMRRRGNYEDYCGTSKQLDVFVTTNTKLVGVTLGFKADMPHLANIQSWKANRLPVITDIRLMCRLWSPASQADRVPLMYLSENTIAATRPTTRYLNKIRELAINLEKDIPAYSNISLPSFFDDSVSDAVFETIKGDETALDLCSFASTIEELSEIKAKEQEEKTNKIAAEKDDVTNKLNTQRDIIISGATKQFKDHLGWRKYVLLFAKNWSIVFSFIIEAVNIFISAFTGNWPIAIYSLLALLLFVLIIKCFVTSKRVQRHMVKKALNIVESSFSKSISKKLRPIEKQYENEIITETINETALIVQCRKLLENDSD